ncbi:DUF6371 domain-containing protein [Dyadobacter sp. 22481]|uniref:DUF6371 domain-containing protein n=1 Tax=Dyadobacter sp. 22481 TaxID=3453926 RepID=UPI003F8684EF
MQSNEYPFRLEKHPKKKEACPSCGHPKVFRYYEDLNGNRLEDFGICDRQNNCGYHAPPRGIKSEGAKEAQPQSEIEQVFPEGKQLDRIVSAIKRMHSNLHTFAQDILGIPNSHFKKWGVGTEFKLTVYAFRNRESRIVNAKYMQYRTDGKREKAHESFSLKQDENQPYKRFMLCLFGEHLLDPDKRRTVIVVESEKSAVIASYFYPQFDWLACGANTGLSDAKIPAVFGRHVIWLCDADKAGRPGKSNSSIRKLAAYHVSHQIIDLFPDREDGYDIADHIIDQRGQKLVDLDDATLVGPKLLSVAREQPGTDADQSADTIDGDETGTEQLPVELATSPADPGAAAADTGENVATNVTISHIEEKAEEVDDEEEDESFFEDDESPQVGLPKQVWHTPEIRKMFRKYGFVEWAGRYWFSTYDGKTFKFSAGSNFTIRPLFLIISKSNPKRIYEVSNCYKKSKVVDLEPGEFVQLDGFRKNVESQGNFIFMGNQLQFMKVKSKLFDESKEAEEVKTLGYHPDGFYAYANGIQTLPASATAAAARPKFTPLDKDGYGIVEHGEKRYFLPPLSKIYKNDEDEYQNAKKFIFNQGTVTFGEYARDFCGVHGDNGRIGLLYYVSCIFRDIIFDRFRCFPHLFLFGPPQTGKSTMAWSISYLFGRARPPFALNTGTSVGFYKHFAEFRNAVVWFDEYLNSIDWGRVQSLKTAYDGNGHTKSDMTRDNRNKSIPVSSGCIVSGQELPTADIALFTRCILLQYDRTDFNHEERQLLDRFHLRGKNLEFGHITAEVSVHRELIENKFFEVYNEQFEHLKSSFSKHGIDDRLVKNMSVLLSTFEVLKDVLQFPFTQAEIRATAGLMLKKQNSLIAGSKETSTFWNLVEYMYRQRMIKENEDFVIKSVPTLTVYENGESTEKTLDDGKPRKVLFLRLGKIQPLYLELHRKQYGKNGLDTGSLKHYLIHSKGFHGSIRNVKFGGSPTSAFAFDYEFMTDSMDSFSLEGLNEEMDSDNNSVGGIGKSTDNQSKSKGSSSRKADPF